MAGFFIVFKLFKITAKQSPELFCFFKINTQPLIFIRGTC
jgi:hypothetical protein